VEKAVHSFFSFVFFRVSGLFSNVLFSLVRLFRGNAQLLSMRVVGNLIMFVFLQTIALACDTRQGIPLHDGPNKIKNLTSPVCTVRRAPQAKQRTHRKLWTTVLDFSMYRLY